MDVIFSEVSACLRISTCLIFRLELMHDAHAARSLQGVAMSRLALVLQRPIARSIDRTTRSCSKREWGRGKRASE